MDILPLFSKPIFVDYINLETKELSEKLGKLNLTNPRNNNSSDQATMYNVLDLDLCSYLKQNILESSIKFTKQEMKHKNDFRITTSWITNTLPNQKSDRHNHNNCYYSGVVYLDTCESCGDLQFQDLSNKRFQLEFEEYNLYNSSSWSIKPRNGLIVIFPSEIFHEVLKNNSNRNRMSIAFNLFPVGHLGAFDSQVVV